MSEIAQISHLERKKKGCSEEKSMQFMRQPHTCKHVVGEATSKVLIGALSGLFVAGIRAHNAGQSSSFSGKVNTIDHV